MLNFILIRKLLRLRFLKENSNKNDVSLLLECSTSRFEFNKKLSCNIFFHLSEDNGKVYGSCEDMFVKYMMKTE